VRVLRGFGVRSMVFTNAAGGINTALEQGNLVLISDHINLQGSNPLVGPNDDRWGRASRTCRRPTRAVPRNRQSRGAGLCASPCRKASTPAMLGPSYETPAEIRFLRTIGADVVGMSTVAEVIAANHMGMKVLAFPASPIWRRASPPGRSTTTRCSRPALVRDTLVKFLRMVLPRLEQE
jgi:purine-nucleoside phosphorylase